MGIIKETEKILEIRSFRNQTVHEYNVIELHLLYQEALEYTEELIKIVDTFNNYLQNEKII